MPRRSWGEARAVLVATTDLGPGDLLTGRTKLRPRPLPMLPEDAIDTDAGCDRPPARRRWRVLVDADVASGTLPR